MSKDQVSRLCGLLDDQVRVFRQRPLKGRYPYLWLDAKVERVREPGGVRQKALGVREHVRASQPVAAGDDHGAAVSLVQACGRAGPCRRRRLCARAPAPRADSV